MPETPIPAQPRPFRRNFRNWLSWSGMVLAASALFAFCLLFAIDLIAGHPNPYIGILAYLIAPLFFLLGIFLAFLGAIIRWRTRRRAVQAAEPLAIKIDLSRPRDRRILALFGFGSMAFLFVTALGSYETYHYTESVAFCGKTCHLPMTPQYVAYQHTAHASVECAACHVGPGAAAYFKTKKYVGNVDRTFQHYLSDEKNTPFAVRLLLNVGGGDPSNGPVGGIHWHMNIANKIEYIATDGQLLKIPWVRMTNAQGATTEYRDPDFREDLSKYQVRQMSCLDCHSRPAHKVHTPNEAVELALMTGRLDPSTPWVKSKVVAALVKPYSTKAEAEQGIANDLRAAYPDPAQANTIVGVAQAIYRENFFPEVKVDWRTYPDFVGHKNWNGCFRCHDGKHVSADGNRSIKASDCNSCHLILAQGTGEALQQISAKGYDFMHIDAPYAEFSCTDCHTGGVQKE